MAQPSPVPAAPPRPLGWGRRYLMVRPSHFRVDYQINPFMDLRRQPSPARAMDQWEALVTAIGRAGGRVETLAQRPTPPTWSMR